MEYARSSRAIAARPWLGWLLGGMLGLVGVGQAAPPERKSSSAQMSINTQPPGATIYLDGQPGGRSPARIENLNPGSYHVRIELDGYRPAELLVNLAAGEKYASGVIELNRIGDPAPPPAEPRPPPPRTIATPVPRLLATPTPNPLATPAPRPLATPSPRRPATPPSRPVTEAPLFPGRLEEAAAPPPRTEDEAIRDLISTHLKTIADGEVEAYVRLFAPKADYFDEGEQTTAGMRKTRQTLNERWPVFEFSNLREVLVRKTSDSAVRRVAFTYDWKASNPTKGRKGAGTASNVFEVRKIAGRWLIVKTRQIFDPDKKTEP